MPELAQIGQEAELCDLPRLPHDELERVASFLGVETGRRLRNAREFAEVLAMRRQQG